jgi:hypothetical protein
MDMKVYLLIIESLHTGVEVEVFATVDAAMVRAREIANEDNLIRLEEAEVRS